MDINEQFQKEVFEDFKLLIQDLSKIQNFSGFLVHHQEIQNLYEKYIFLKQINTFKYQQFFNKEVIEQAEEVEVLKKELAPEAPQNEAKAEVQIDAPVETQIEPEIQPSSEEEKAEAKTETAKQEQINDDSYFFAEVEKILSEKDENESNLPPVQMDVQDSIDFISRLFNGDKDAMDKEMKRLDETDNLDEVRTWMEEMFHKYNWKGREEYIERLSGLILKRFE